MIVLISGKTVQAGYRHSFHAPDTAFSQGAPPPVGQDWARHPAATAVVGEGVTCRVRAPVPSRELPKIVQYPGSGPGVEVLPRTRRNHGCDRRAQEAVGGGGGRKLPQIPHNQCQGQYHDPSYDHAYHHEPARDSIHLAYENENMQYRQRSLPRTPAERGAVGGGSPRKSPKRTADPYYSGEQQLAEDQVPDKRQSHKSQRWS